MQTPNEILTEIKAIYSQAYVDLERWSTINPDGTRQSDCSIYDKMYNLIKELTNALSQNEQWEITAKPDGVTKVVRAKRKNIFSVCAGGEYLEGTDINNMRFGFRLDIIEAILPFLSFS